MHSNPLPISICSEENFPSSSFNNKQKTYIRSNSCMCTAVYDDQQNQPITPKKFSKGKSRKFADEHEVNLFII
jgi:hypothetical protein